jgi:hypothetical protein
LPRSKLSAQALTTQILVGISTGNYNSPLTLDRSTKV